MVDDPDARSGADAAHLEDCTECKARFENVSGDAHAVATLLAVPEAHVDVARAFDRVKSAPAARPRFGFRLPVVRPASRPMVLAFAAVIAGVALLAGVIARDYSLNYTPNTVTTVPVTVADVQALSQLADYGTLTWTKQPTFQAATSAADASAIAGGMQPPVVTDLPKGISTNITYGAMSQAVAVFTFSGDKARAAAAAHGKTAPTLPAGMDGATLTVSVGPAVGEIFGDLKQPASASDASQINLPQLIVAKSTAPTATSTQVTVTQFENFVLAQPGITPELKAAVKAIGNPGTTLLIPIPVQYATSKNVTVQGVQGVALGDNTGVGSAVIWIKNSVVYAVAGSVKQTDAINIANNLK
jgi:hypothetical protein